MKLLSVYSRSHERLKEEWLLATLKDDYELSLHESATQGRGRYMEEDWIESVLFKSRKIIQTIEENWGGVFVYADADIQFFAPTRQEVLKALEGKDIVCQLDNPSGNLCTGFFAARANAATLELWQAVQAAIPVERRDQIAFNRIARQIKGLRHGCLPVRFFSAGTFTGRMWEKGDRVYVPRSPIMHHANWAVGVEDKVALLEKVREIVEGGGWSIARNNAVFCFRHGARGPRLSRAAAEHARARDGWGAGSFTRPRVVCLDASTVCQLKCPSCPTALGLIREKIGAGYLRFEDFRRFLRRHPGVSSVELSNWGEIFLNPDLPRIMRHAYERNVALRADNGVNLDRATEEALEALVKYKVRSLTCSIDGASQETYAIYRVKGNFHRVIGNIRRINAHKEAYRCRYPLLRWQFVAFGHNEHEISLARALAKELEMTFYVKLSWDDLYTASFSPVRDRELIRRESGLGVADRREFGERLRKHYVGETCHQMWLAPRINHDGRLLGCSINYWGDYGNVFEQGLDRCLNGDRMKRAREMLMGTSEASDDIPCATCKVYLWRRERNTWVREQDLAGRRVESRAMNWIRNRWESPELLSLIRRLRGLVKGNRERKS